MDRILFWLKNSRLFSIPMSILSWLVIFVYCLKLDGNIVNGVLALLGIVLGQLATNLFDDYIDYRKLNSKNSQVCKCAYIRNGEATINDVLLVVAIYLLMALFIGVALCIRIGLPVSLLALIGGIIVLSYPKLSQKGFSEVAVGIAFGPLLFEGVHYVMLNYFSITALLISLPVVMFTIGLMYVHTVLDYEGDIKSHKNTLCSRFSKDAAINGVLIVYSLGYIFTILLILYTKNYYLFITFILIPLIFDLHKSLKSFTCGGKVKDFYFRLLKARNLMIYYSCLLCILFMLT